MMQRSFYRLSRAPKAHCGNAGGTYAWIQKLARPISSDATHFYNSKDSGRRTVTSDTNNSGRRRAYEYSSPEAAFGRHVLRSILRECSYLPDSFTADYIKKHALSRFRTNEYKAWEDREQFKSQYHTRRKEARSAISTLQRANEGERKPLLKVLYTAYGRIGKKRHELMRPLLYVEGQNEVLNSASIPGTSITTEQAPPTTKLSPSTPLNLTSQLRALLKSQMQARPPTTVRRNPRSIEPSIPELNSWLRPMPQNRIRNARKKHYANLLDRVQPPLPTEEWERLRDLASGKLPAVGAMRSRRRAALPARERGAGDVLKTERSALELVALHGRVPKKALDTGRVDAKRNSARFMQRLYADVFSQCPLMEWDSVKEEWKVTWGFQALSLPVPRTQYPKGHVANHRDLPKDAVHGRDGSASNTFASGAVG